MSNHPNRSRSADRPAPPSPAPATIAAVRSEAGLTIAEAAGLVSADAAAWSRWEEGERPMSPGAWAVFREKLAAQG